MTRIMHEMSIAQSIVDIAIQTMEANGGHVIHAVQLQLGLMSGVEPDSLLFCFDIVTKGTLAQGAKLEIETIPIKGRCLDCDQEFGVEDYKFVCPKCGSHFIQTISGRELKVATIDMD